MFKTFGKALYGELAILLPRDGGVTRDVAEFRIPSCESGVNSDAPLKSDSVCPFILTRHKAEGYLNLRHTPFLRLESLTTPQSLSI